MYREHFLCISNTLYVVWRFAHIILGIRNNVFVRWAALDNAVQDVPPYKQLFVLKDANARLEKIGEREVGRKDNEVLGANGRDTLNDNRERLFTFAANHSLAPANAFFSARTSGTSRTSNGSGQKK